MRVVVISMWVVPLYYLIQCHVVTSVIKWKFVYVVSIIVLCQTQYRHINVSHMILYFWFSTIFTFESKVRYASSFSLKKCHIFPSINWYIKCLLFQLLNMYVCDNHYLIMLMTKQVGSCDNLLTYADFHSHRLSWLKVCEIFSTAVGKC